MVPNIRAGERASHMMLSLFVQSTPDTWAARQAEKEGAMK